MPETYTQVEYGKFIVTREYTVEGDAVTDIQLTDLTWDDTFTTEWYRGIPEFDQQLDDEDDEALIERLHDAYLNRKYDKLRKETGNLI